MKRGELIRRLKKLPLLVVFALCGGMPLVGFVVGMLVASVVILPLRLLGIFTGDLPGWVVGLIWGFGWLGTLVFVTTVGVRWSRGQPD